MSPKVSVIIPVYGVEPYLPACLDSVLASTLPDIEVIAVDDVSPDRCPQIIDDYAARDSRVMAVHLEQNGGQGIARNEGFARASGEYVYFLDSDDMVAADALEKLYARAKADDLDGVFFDSDVVFETPELAKRNMSYPTMRSGEYRDGVYTGIDLYREFERQREWTCYVQRQFWRRQFLIDEGIEFPAAYSHEDEFFAFSAILTARRVAYMREPFFIRRYREGSVMTSPFTARGFYSYFDCYWRMAEFLAEHDIDDPLVLQSPARIYAAIENHYDRLSRTEDLRGWMANEDERRVFDFYVLTKSKDLQYNILSDDVLEKAAAAEHLYIYGAGVLGKRTCRSLEVRDIAVDGFFVTSAKGNATTLLGHRVREFDTSVPPSQKTLVIIGVTDGYRKEIEGILEEAGWSYIYYK